MDNLKNRPGTDKLKGFNPYHLPPFRIFVIMALSIFAVEFLVMIILLFIPHRSPVVHALVDSTMLLLLLSPILYFFLFRPLITVISERDIAERDLIRERKQFQKYLSIAGVIIVVLDPEGRVKLINKKGCSVLGYKEDDIVGKNWVDNFIPERIRGEVKINFEHLRKWETEAAGYFENPVLTKDGEERIILWHNISLMEDGRFSGTLSSGEDITERKRAEEALRDSEARYRLIHNTVFDGIIITGSDDRIIDINPSAEKMFGYDKGGLTGADVAIIMPESYRKRHRDALKKFLDTGVSTMQGRIVELEGLRKNGEVFPIELMISTFIIGGEINFTGTIREITERKRAEKEKEFIQAQLSQSQKMEAIGRFAGGIAHDFNNILSSIRGNTELAMEDIDRSHPLYSRLEGIILSILHASKLTRQLLLFSRGQPFELVPFNINRTVENLLTMIGRLIGEDIIISTGLAEDLWMIQADEGNIEQVIMNLAINAKDAMPEGGRLTIKTENVVFDEEKCREVPEARPGRAICLTVADTGKGMEKELMQHIFEPFFTTKEPGKGMGFGLAMVYGIVRQHRGWITVESEPGVGTAFRLCLPALEEKIKRTVRETAEKTRPRGQGERILLVEDDITLREFSKTALIEDGYVVFEAESAKEAIEVFKKENLKFDLIFTDVVLPDQTGFQLANHLLSKRPGLIALLTGSYMDIKSRLTPVNEKKFRYLQKPYSLMGLLRAVENTIEQNKIKQ